MGRRLRRRGVPFRAGVRAVALLPSVRIHAQVLAAGNVPAPAEHVLAPHQERRELLL
jgi:hypothetical protein